MGRALVPVGIVEQVQLVVRLSVPPRPGTVDCGDDFGALHGVSRAQKKE
jgi:hypothetical protein